MVRIHLPVVAVALSLVTMAPAALADQGDGKFEFRDGDRVVFLGNTLIERAQRYGYWETMLTARHPNKNITFRNLGWSGDTVWAESRGMFDPPRKGYERMIEHVERLKPTVILLGYGGNEAYAGKQGLEPFIRQYNRLLNDLKRVSAEGVRFVILTPLRHVETDRPLPSAVEANRRLSLYGYILELIAAKRGAHLVDLFNEFHGYPVFPGETAAEANRLTHDGIHLNAFGYRLAACTLAKELGLDDSPYREVIASFDGTVKSARGVKVVNVESDGDSLTVKFESRLLPYMPSPSPKWSMSADLWLIQGVQPGRYALKIDGKQVAVEEELTGSVLFDMQSGPHFDRVEKLRRAIIEKNRLYFHRWRPQNITYLFGFRKHEQGHNAEELKEFDRLIAEKEKEIAKLKEPVPHTYEITRLKK